MPQAPVPSNSQYDPRREDLEFCPDCQHFAWRDKGHVCPGKPRMAWRGPLVGLAIMLITILMVLALLWVAFSPNSARGATPKPIAAPQSLLRERAQCKHVAYQQDADNLAMSARIVEQCLRDRLVEAYQAIQWQRKQTLELAREMVGNVAAWTCIHNGKGAAHGTGEGPWNDRGDPYWGGLQMDRGFMRTYGMDMIRKHHGGLADTWTPREQIIVAQRAFIQGRGYAPWPQTSHACGLR